MTLRRPSTRSAFACAVVLCGLLGAAACGAHGAATASHGGLPIYPNATVIGTNSDALAIYRSSDSFGTVADWYAAHMPAGTQSSRNDAVSQATYAVFSPAETKTVHVEISDGTVRITMTVVKAGPAPATGR
jgi:hypothetical protein